MYSMVLPSGVSKKSFNSANCLRYSRAVLALMAYELATSLTLNTRPDSLTPFLIKSFCTKFNRCPVGVLSNHSTIALNSWLLWFK